LTKVASERFTVDVYIDYTSELAGDSTNLQQKYILLSGNLRKETTLPSIKEDYI
jgi:hypothetical protein